MSMFGDWEAVVAKHTHIQQKQAMERYRDAARNEAVALECVAACAGQPCPRLAQYGFCNRQPGCIYTHPDPESLPDAFAAIPIHSPASTAFPTLFRTTLSGAFANPQLRVEAARGTVTMVDRDEDEDFIMCDCNGCANCDWNCQQHSNACGWTAVGTAVVVPRSQRVAEGGNRDWNSRNNNQHNHNNGQVVNNSNSRNGKRVPNNQGTNRNGNNNNGNNSINNNRSGNGNNGGSNNNNNSRSRNGNNGGHHNNNNNNDGNNNHSGNRGGNNNSGQGRNSGRNSNSNQVRNSSSGNSARVNTRQRGAGRNNNNSGNGRGRQQGGPPTPPPAYRGSVDHDMVA